MPPSVSTSRPRLGLIINPIAGMGGKVGLKGTDGPALLAEARRLGAVPLTGKKARRALAEIRGLAGKIELLAAFGDLGETVARESGFDPKVVGGLATFEASATRAAATAMIDAGVDLILFAAGDGTARDILDSVGNAVPVLGIPAGVKMHSAVFATSPENAGKVAAQYLSERAPQLTLRDAEVMDLEDDAPPGSSRQARLYGYLRVPYVRSRVQHAKAGRSADSEADLDALCQEIAGDLSPGSVHLFGPGTTTQKIMRDAGFDGTLLGVDAVSNGRLVGRDLSEAGILALTEGKPVHVIVGVVGGQGFLFGRGNQQISAEVLRRTGRDNITVVSARDKILALDEHRLLLDTGDCDVDAALAGYIRVRTAPGQALMCKVAA